MSILAVGVVAIDDIETPFGRAEGLLGGSATYFSLAASLFTQVNLVAAVGRDFPDEYREVLRSRNLDLRGLQVADGNTFRWAGQYEYDLNVARTLNTQINVYTDFHPVLPDGYAESDFLFLANMDPELQQEARVQVRKPRLTLLDTMNFWIQGKRDSLLRAIALSDMVTMNDAEARLLTGTSNLYRAAREVLNLGPNGVIVKKGEAGAALVYRSSYYVTPAYPLEDVKDPTGAGDSFAGGFLGYLDAVGSITERSLHRALVYGSAVASFTVQEFGVAGLRSITLADVEQRYQEFLRFTHFGLSEEVEG